MRKPTSYEIMIGSARTPPAQARSLLRKAIAATLRRHEVKDARLSVALVGDALIARLNRTHLAHRGSTDVLSFDLRDPRTANGAIEGELVISLDTAHREARKRGLAVSAELALYAVHGVLHLLGYDDRTGRAAARMYRREDEILGSLGLHGVRGEPHSRAAHQP